MRQLITYFEGVSDLESRTAKELTKLSTFIQVPFPAANLFLSKGGIQVCLEYSFNLSIKLSVILQDTFHKIRDKAHAVAGQHATPVIKYQT